MLTPTINPADDWYLCEDLLTFCQLARRIGVNPSTVWRWHKKGCVSKKGVRVKLRGCRRGGRNVTSLPRYDEFVRQTNDDDDGAPGDSIPSLPKAVALACAQLTDLEQDH
jgi:hypothetical protein